MTSSTDINKTKQTDEEQNTLWFEWCKVTNYYERQIFFFSSSLTSESVESWLCIEWKSDVVRYLQHRFHMRILYYCMFAAFLYAQLIPNDIDLYGCAEKNSFFSLSCSASLSFSDRGKKKYIKLIQIVCICR